MNLEALSNAISAHTDGVTVDGPWPTPTGWEVTVGDRLGNGRTVTVTDDGVARWVPHGLPRRVRSKRLPQDLERAAEIVSDLVYR